MENDERKPSLVEAYQARLARVAVESWNDFDLRAMVDLARELIGVPMASITILDNETFHFLVSAGSEPFCTDYDDAMCKYSMGKPGLFMVPDTLEDERMADLPFVDGRAASLRFYASTPIYARGGVMVGRFCIFDDEARVLEPEHEQLLERLADAAGKAIQRKQAASSELSDV